MDRPKKLYKYRGASTQDLTNLASGKLWICRPSRFNDPFDCAYSVVIPELSRDDCVRMLETISNGQFNKSNLARFADDVLKTQVAAGLKTAVANGLSAVGGVCCFSAIPDSLLMWGHYSDSHRGFCLEFDTADEPLFAKTKQVRYTDDLPTLGKETFTKWDFSQVMNLLLTKAKCWEYEREWRVLHQQADLLFGYARSSLTGIYFGAKMPEEQIQMIASLLVNTDTALYRMRVSQTTFDLVSEPLTFTPIDYRGASKK